jgi:hypothetical protein
MEDLLYPSQVSTTDDTLFCFILICSNYVCVLSAFTSHLLKITLTIVYTYVLF